MNSSPVMERSIIHKGKVFIKENEENGRAYVIQNGNIRSFKTIEDRKITVAEYGPGTIIGESSLFLDEPMEMGFEALNDTTVITITRQDFQKRLQKADKMLSTVMEHLLTKLRQYSLTRQDDVLKASEIDEKTIPVVRQLLKGIDESKQREYELALMPHIDGLLKTFKAIKAEQDKT